MAEYIDREDFCKNICKCNKNGCDKSQCAIWKTPTADVEEVKHGEWIHTDIADHWHSKDECSECGYHTFDRIDLSHFNYCPNCGAKMDGGKEE